MINAQMLQTAGTSENVKSHEGNRTIAPDVMLCLSSLSFLPLFARSLLVSSSCHSPSRPTNLHEEVLKLNVMNLNQ
jgi:hypothetical protein